MSRFWRWLTAQPQDGDEAEWLKRYTSPLADWHQRRHSLRFFRERIRPQ